MVFLANNQ